MSFLLISEYPGIRNHGRFTPGIYMSVKGTDSVIGVRGPYASFVTIRKSSVSRVFSMLGVGILYAPKKNVRRIMSAITAHSRASSHSFNQCIALEYFPQYLSDLIFNDYILFNVFFFLHLCKWFLC